MLKIILLCVIGMIIYLALGAIAAIEHFERMGLHSGWCMLFWPIVYLGFAIAWVIIAIDEGLNKILIIAKKIKHKWGKKK